MFTEKLKKAIADTLYYGLNEDTDNPKYRCYVDPVQQGLEPPCFVIEQGISTMKEMIMGRLNERTLFNVTYFPENEEEYTSEFAELTAKLYLLMRTLSDHDTGESYHTQSFEITPSEGQLNIQFAITYEVLDVAEHPLMEGLTTYERKKQR